MQSCDALVVGGGPAGSTCARRLRRAGLDVMVMGKPVFPRDKVCAGWITPGVLAESEVDTQEYATTGRVIQPITGFRTSILGRQEVETKYERVVSYGILRREFDHYLLRRSAHFRRSIEGHGAARRALDRQRLHQNTPDRRRRRTFLPARTPCWRTTRQH